MMTTPVHESDDDRITDAMLRWEECWQSGKELSAVELCGDRPDLVGVLEREIKSLKATDWLAELDAVEEFTPTKNGNGRRNGNGHLPATSLTPDQFAESVCTSGLLTPEELSQFRRENVSEDSAADTRSLAEKLVSQGKLTTYQARVVLEQRSDPLLIDRYIILDALEAGGMGLVFKAMHKQLERMVALKVLPAAAVDSPEKVERFRREAKAVAKLSHPNIVHAYDADEAGGTHFLVMEYVPGQDLQHYVLEYGPLSVAQAVACTLQAARGLEHAHQQGIVHRDIKPANLLVESRESRVESEDSSLRHVVKVADLGLAAIETGGELGKAAQHLTQDGAVLGTIAYMAPEQALDTKTADARSDVYSLGATLHFLLTGRPPYNEDSALKTLVAHQNQPIPRLGEQRGDVPAALEEAFVRMLAKDPRERFASMTEVIAALEQIDVDDNECTLSPPISISPTADTDACFASVEQTVTYRSGVAQTESPPKAIAGVNRRLSTGLWLSAAALLVLAGIVIIVKSRDGGEIRVEVPDGGSVAIVNDDGSKSAPITPLTRRDLYFEATPEQQAFFDAVARLARPAQLQAVADKLKQVNPQFPGTLNFANLDGHDTTLVVRDGWLTNMWPLAAVENLVLDAEIGPETNLSPLANLPLAHLTGVTISPINERAAELVGALPTLKSINRAPVEQWLARPQEIEELRQILPTLTTGTQLAQIVAKLKEYNPGFDGELTDYTVEDEEVARIDLYGQGEVVDLLPLRALPALKSLDCNGTGIADLSPLQGLPLTEFRCQETRVSDLSALEGMPLTILNGSYTNVSDLSPLQGMPLERLNCLSTRVSDLSPLQGMPLKYFHCNALATDFEPLSGLPLEAVWLQFPLYHNAAEDVLKSLPLQRINGPRVGGQPASSFWEKVAARRTAAETFRDKTSQLPPSEQIAAVAARLMELQSTPRICSLDDHELHDDAVVVVTLGGKPSDVTPLMAFTKLQKLIFANPDPGGWQYVDISPVSTLPLKELICPDVIALANAAVLRACESLETINGEPAGEYLDALLAGLKQ